LYRTSCWAGAYIPRNKTTGSRKGDYLSCGINVWRWKHSGWNAAIAGKEREILWKTRGDWKDQIAWGKLI